MCWFMFSIMALQFFIILDISCMSIIGIWLPSIMCMSSPFSVSELPWAGALVCSANPVATVPRAMKVARAVWVMALRMAALLIYYLGFWQVPARDCGFARR
ncbi:hypothetical protein D3C75_1241400 [compost metagenome]